MLSAREGLFAASMPTRRPCWAGILLPLTGISMKVPPVVVIEVLRCWLKGTETEEVLTRVLLRRWGIRSGVRMERMACSLKSIRKMRSDWCISWRGVAAGLAVLPGWRRGGYFEGERFQTVRGKWWDRLRAMGVPILPRPRKPRRIVGGYWRLGWEV